MQSITLKRAVLPLALVSVFALSGCAATQVAIAKRDLDVQTKMSATVFLEPAPAAERTVFVQIRNTSDKTLDLEADVARGIAARGYTVVQDPAAARYMLQANILHVGKTDPTAAQAALRDGYGTGYGTGVTGAVVGAGSMYALGGDHRGALGAAIVGGIVETVASAAIKDVYYSVVTDVQIRERARGAVKTVSQHDVKQGTSGSTQVTYAEDSEWKTYQTRVVSTANKMNLEFVEAEPALRAGISRALAGLF